MNNEYTFENFFTYDNNTNAKTATIEICKNLGKLYNPLYIYGGVGLGKTHLLQAIANKIRNENPALNIVNTTSDEYFYEFQDHLRKDAFLEFRMKFQIADVLLFEADNEFDFNHVLNAEFDKIIEAMLASRKQIVFTSPCAICDLINRLEPLKTKLKNGLSIELKAPDYDARLILLLKRCESIGKSLPSEVLKLIAQNRTSNISDLYSDFLKLFAYSDLEKKKITFEIAKSILNYSAFSKLKVNKEDILKVASEHFQISKTEVERIVNKE